jgi:cell division protein FtsZ
MSDIEQSSSIPTKSSRKPRNNMSLKLDIPHPEIMKPKIIIFGVGGAGGNALNNMIRSNLEGVEFVAANTDSQALTNSLTENRIQLGVKTTKGLGAGSFPDRGKLAAEENLEEIEKYLEGCNMVFIAAGMGGGTGTGAAPVIAKLARERDILTVGVVTKPFHFEGKYRMETAETGIEELKKFVDTLIVIPNQNLFRIANESTTFESAFKMADDVLYAGVRGVTDLITMPGLVNLDFADIRTIMTKMGKAMMGTGEATGENRAILACEAAIANPLLDDISIKGAKGVLVNMTGGPDMTLFEADMAVNAIRKEVDSNANIIFGSAFDENMKGIIRISVVATGIDSEEFRRENFKNKEVHEPTRFKVNNDISHSNNSKNFFDPGVPAKSSKEIYDEIDNENFKPKRSFSKDHDNELHENPEDLHFNKKTTQQNLSHQENHFSNSSEHENIEHNHHKKSPLLNIENHEESPFEDDHVFSSPKIDFYNHDDEKPRKNIDKKDKKPIKTKPEKAKKDTGFSLFSFMNNKEKTDIHDEENEHDNPSDKKSKQDIKLFHDKTKSENNSDSRDTSHEIERKRQQFFGHSTIFDDEETLVNNEKFDDNDIVNVPAFFRRKK